MTHQTPNPNPNQYLIAVILKIVGKLTNKYNKEAKTGANCRNVGCLNEEGGGINQKTGLQLQSSP